MRRFGWSLLCAVGLSLLVAGTVFGLDSRVAALVGDRAAPGEAWKVANLKKAVELVAANGSAKLDAMAAPTDPKVEQPFAPPPPVPPSDWLGAVNDDDDDDRPFLGGIVSGY